MSIPDLLKFASQATMEGAFSDGKAIGMSPTAIYNDLERAKLAYFKDHARQESSALRDDVNGCLDRYYGRPND